MILNSSVLFFGNYLTITDLNSDTNQYFSIGIILLGVESLAYFAYSCRYIDATSPIEIFKQNYFAIFALFIAVIGFYGLGYLCNFGIFKINQFFTRQHSYFTRSTSITPGNN